MLLLVTLFLALPDSGARAAQPAPQHSGGQAGVIRLTGCEAGYTRPDFRALRATYQASIARWKAAEPRNYRFELSEWAAPVRFPTVTVSVRQRISVSATVKPGEQGTPGPQARQTMARRFLSVWATIVRSEKMPCPTLEIEYDPHLGFPSRLNTGQAGLAQADGNGGWQISEFRTLP